MRDCVDVLERISNAVCNSNCKRFCISFHIPICVAHSVIVIEHVRDIIVLVKSLRKRHADADPIDDVVSVKHAERRF